MFLLLLLYRGMSSVDAKIQDAANACSSQSGNRPSSRAALFSIVACLTALATLSGCGGSQTTSNEFIGRVDRVVVKKSERKLELISHGKVVRKYRVALGNAPEGHKYREGDGRTPVGNYVLNWRNPDSNFYKAIHISYPNPQDRLNSQRLGYKPGGSIMLHGMPKYIQSKNVLREYANRDWTKGCIAVQNHEMDEIWHLVPDGTPIQILP